MLHAAHLAELQDGATAFWHDASLPAPLAASGFEELVLAQHRANFDLWHREDAARDPLASDRTIAEVKHAIDALNQRRNDLAERLDGQLLDAAQAAAAPPAPGAPLHSETPGLMIDRLSILALKIFHTAEESGRSTPEHRAANAARLSILHEQRADLTACLGSLWDDVLTGRRRFKLYRQLKMYNDPELNPVLYAGARR